MVAAAAHEAARETYQNSLIAGYEQKISDMQIEHDKEKRDLQTQMENAVQATKQQEKAAHAALVTSAQAAGQEATSRLNEALFIKKQAAETVREQEVAHAKRIGELQAESKAENEELKAQIARLKASHDQKTQALQRQLKLEINFVSKSLKTRTFHRHPDTLFLDLIEDLLKDMRKKKPLLDRNGVRFTHERIPIVHGSRSLANVSQSASS